MVSKEACYKGPPFKTRFHELDGCQASGKAKNDARCSVAIASLSSLFWYDKEYILEFIFRWKTTQGLVKNVIKSSILFVTKEWRGAVYFLFYVEQTRQACLNPQKRFSFCQNDAGMLRYEKQVKFKKKQDFLAGGKVTQSCWGNEKMCWGSDTSCWGSDSSCWGNEAILLGKWHKNRWGDAPNTKCSIPTCFNLFQRVLPEAVRKSCISPNLATWKYSRAGILHRLDKDNFASAEEVGQEWVREGSQGQSRWGRRTKS